MKKPDLKILGIDGNAFSILAKARRVAKKEKMPWDEIFKKATQKDYNYLLATLAKYFNII